MTMTPGEFEAEMIAIRENNLGYTEIIHILQDQLMVKVLKELGYGGGAYVFEDSPGWYS